MRSLAQRDGEGHAAQLAADIEDMEIAARSIRNGYRIIMHRRRAVRRVLQQMMARIFPGGDIDARRRGRGPDGGQRVEVAVAPFLGLARGKGGDRKSVV